LGLPEDSRCSGQSGPRRGPHNNRKYLEATRYRTSTRTKSQDDWKEFLNRHWDQIVAADFFTVEVWTCSGLTRFVILFFIDLSTRKIQIGGIASSANGFWMTQIARNLTDVVDGFSSGKRYLIHDRDPQYTKEFLAITAGVGIESMTLPPRSPNLKT